jgi:hypothetical protein
MKHDIERLQSHLLIPSNRLCQSNSQQANWIGHTKAKKIYKISIVLDMPGHIDICVLIWVCRDHTKESG